MSYGHHQRPGHPPYGHKPASGGGGVMKACLIVGGIVSGIGLVVIIGCGIGAWVLGSRVMDEVESMESEMATVEDLDAPVTPPTDLDQAIVYLNKDEENYHRAAAEWLSSQPLNRAYQGRVNKGLMVALNSSDVSGRRAAVQALKIWGDASSAGEVAASLRSGDALNRDKLELLGRWGRTIAAEDIAKLLDSAGDAENAYQALKRIGPGAAPPVAEYLSKTGRSAEYAKQLMEEWGMDPDEALVNLYVQRLNSDDSRNRSSAAKRLAVLDFDPMYQDSVIRAVKTAYTADLGDKGELMNVLLKWGNESCLDIVHKAIRDDGWDKSEALQVAVNIRNPSSVPVIAELLDEFGGDGNEAVDALVGFGDDAIEPTLSYFNHENDYARDRARRVFRELDVPEDRLIDQAVEDMRSGEEGRATAACQWIETIDVVTDRRSEVASAMANAIEDVNVFKKREIVDTFCEWATESETDLLLDLVEESDDNVWLPAFERLLAFDDPESIKHLTADLLTNFFKRDEALKAMQLADPPVEDLAIIMLGHNDEKVCYEMCRILSVVGGEKALRPLEDLIDRAAKARETELVGAARLTRTEIKSRVAAAKRAAEDNGDGDSDDGDSGDGGDDS